MVMHPKKLPYHGCIGYSIKANILTKAVKQTKTDNTENHWEFIQQVKGSKNTYFESAKEILLDNKTRSRGIFNCTNIEKLLMNNENLEYDFWGKKIWMLMNVEMWHRQVIDQ